MLTRAVEQADALSLDLPRARLKRDIAAIRSDYYDALKSCESAQAKYNNAVAAAELAALEFSESFQAASEIATKFGHAAAGGTLWERFVDLSKLPKITGSAVDGGFYAG